MKKFVSVFLCFLLTLSLCLTGSFSVYAQEVTEETTDTISEDLTEEDEALVEEDDEDLLENEIVEFSVIDEADVTGDDETATISDETEEEGLVEEYSAVDEATVSTSDDSIIAEGSFASISWVLDGDYTLTVSGNGKIPDCYDYYFETWQPYSESIKSIVIEEGITSIGYAAFAGCVNCTSVSFPETLTFIDWNAFREIGLTSVTIPGNVTTIEEYAFSFCENLETVTILEGTTTIGYNVFSYDPKLTTVYLPSSTVDIYFYAFGNDKSLKTVYYNGYEEEFLKINMDIDTTGGQLLHHASKGPDSFIESYLYYYGDYDGDYYSTFLDGTVSTTPVKFVFKDGSIASREENITVKTTSSDTESSSTKTSTTSASSSSSETEEDILTEGSPKTDDPTTYSYYIVMMGLALTGLELLRTRKADE